jgi:hypothetical protein
MGSINRRIAHTAPIDRSRQQKSHALGIILLVAASAVPPGWCLFAPHGVFMAALIWINALLAPTLRLDDVQNGPPGPASPA